MHMLSTARGVLLTAKKELRRSKIGLLYPDEPTGENWHENFIVHLASIVRPETYVEFGLYECAVFNRIIPYAQQLIGVDVQARAAEFMRVSDKVKFAHMTTEEFSQQLVHKPIAIDLLFIDADHSHATVLSDFRNMLPFIRPHGMILLHDTHPRDQASMDPGLCGDGWMAVEGLSLQTREYEMVTIPIHPGLTICRKRRSQLSWKINSE
jgi:predicted O-methyltransferase YrrM